MLISIVAIMANIFDNDIRISISAHLAESINSLMRS